ncbi:MAG TPA: YlbF family regulator [Bacilli bacterium]|nr:YlbF family regulator [Bacilli bacterium]
MSNLYDKAHELSRALRTSNEYVAMKDLYEQVMNDTETKKIFISFRDLQLSLQRKQMQGEQITEEEAVEAQKQFELVQQNELMTKLFEAEQRLSMIVADVNQIITEPLNEIYGEITED